MTISPAGCGGRRKVYSMPRLAHVGEDGGYAPATMAVGVFYLRLLNLHMP